MENPNTSTDRKQSRGIHLNHLNVLLIFIGMVIALFMVFSMYQTSNSFNQIVSVTETYLSAQQTAGMLNNISVDMAEQCTAFIHSGTPDLTYAYAGQLNAIDGQIEANAAYADAGESEDEFLVKALAAFRTKIATETRAMRLMADTLPMGLEAFPPLIQQTELSEEDRALSPEEKKKTALGLISSEEYLALGTTISDAVDDSHRVASEKGKNRAMQTAAQVEKVMRRQKILVFLFVLIAMEALFMNRALIISPIQRSVENLDKREPLPVVGSYEVRHLANVYNEVLKDNAKKTAALSHAATHDFLTGLKNRSEFDRLYKESKEEKVGIMIADVDRFKQFNDEFGHEVGDRVIKVVADKLTEHFRPEDHVCRIGGDEFCVIMPGIGQEQAGAVTDIIRKINHELQGTGTGLPPITISAGFAFWDRPNPGESLFRDADDTLLSVKKTRTDCCAVYPG